MRQQSNRAEIRQAIEDAKQAVRDASQDARTAAQDAKTAAQDAKRAAQDAVTANTPTEGGTRPIVVTQKNGETVTIDMKDGNLLISQNGNTKVIPWRDAVPNGAVQIAWAFPVVLAILVIGWPLTRAVTGWLRRKAVVSNDTAALEARLRERFETLERNVDTVAIEVEKLAEGQRFTNRLIAERQTGVPAPVAVGVSTVPERGA